MSRLAHPALLAALTVSGCIVDRRAADDDLPAAPAPHAQTPGIRGAADAPAASSARHAEVHPVAPRVALDVLFVVDDSATMCGHQADLTAAFERIVDDLGDVDLRVAVTSTDMQRPDGGAFTQDHGDVDAACGHPGRVACDRLWGPGGPPPVLGEDAPTPAEWAQQFRCRAAAGTDGDGFEQGLAALRASLSCDGPNAALLGHCGARPAHFARPHADLRVILVSDEDDCSGPVSRADASECYWRADALTPVDAYEDFLRGLKPERPDAVSVWSFVGPEALTEAGFPIHFAPGTPRAECDPGSRRYDPTLSWDACCPDGACAGPPQPTCRSSRGATFTGRRYARLARRFTRGCDPNAGCDLCRSGVDLGQLGAPAESRAWCLAETPECVALGRVCGPADFTVDLRCEGASEPCSPGPLPADLVLNGSCASGVAARTRAPLPAGAAVHLSYR